MSKKTSLLITDLLVTPNRKIWLLFDIVTIGILYTLAQTINPYSESLAFKRVAEQIFISALIYGLSFGLTGVGLGIYDRSERFRIRKLVLKIPLAWFLSLLVSVAIMYFVYYDKFGRLTFFIGSIAAAFGLFCIKVVLAQVIYRNPYRFVILSKSSTAEAIIKAVSSNDAHEKMYELYRSDTPLTPDTLRHERIVDVIVGEDNLRDKQTLDLCFSALQIGCRIIDEIDFYAQTFSRLPIAAIRKDWVLKEGFQNRRLMSDALKRIFDIVAATSGLIVTSPLLILIYLLIWLEDRQSPILLQERQGRYCRPFQMLKFRTMKTVPELSDQGFTETKDPRITRIGRLIRPLHLDELPQLVNIVQGQMSIVGPRPEMLYFARKMSREVELYDLRYMFRPGLTGHAQLLTGYGMDNVEATRLKLSADLYYICKRTFLLDLGIIVRTVFKLTAGAR